jgi:hypothetical protein
MLSWRRRVGTALLFGPLMVVIVMVPLGALLGSMGMDIHWTSARDAYFGWTCIALIVCGCVVGGIRLRRRKS